MSKIALTLPPGLRSIDTSYASQDTWREADKVRFYQNSAQVIGGWTAMSPSTLTGTCRNIVAWKDNIGASLAAFGTNSNLYIYRSGSIYDITPSGFTPGAVNGSVGPGYGVGGYSRGGYGLYSGADGGSYWPQTWSLSDLGQSLIASPRGGGIYWWQNNTATTANTLASYAPATMTAANGTTTAWVNYIPSQNNFMLVTPQRQVLTFGCNQQYASNGATPGPYNPLCIRGSDIDGNITVWGPNNSNNAFEYTLPNGGLIVSARNWGSLLAIWTQDGLYSGTFTGATDSVWSFQAVDGSVGLLGPMAACVIGDIAYWVSGDLQVWSCAVGAVPEQLDCPIQTDTLDMITPGQQEKVVMSYCSATNELRIDYPDVRDGIENSRYLTLYLNDGSSWSQGQLGRTAYDRGAPLQWPIGAGPPDANNQTKVYFHEYGHSADNQPFSWSITSNDICLDEDETSMYIRGLWPDFADQQGAVNLTISARPYPQSNSTVYGPYLISVGQPRIDLRVTGRLINITLSGQGNPTSCRIGRLDIDAVPAGSR